MITTRRPPPTNHPSQRPGIPLFQRSVLPSHPRTCPRNTRIVYPHRTSSTPLLSSASTPPHEPSYLFLAAVPTQRASSSVPERVHRVTVAPTPYRFWSASYTLQRAVEDGVVPLCTRTQLSAAALCLQWDGVSPVCVQYRKVHSCE
jgi:hypothetical protein